MTFPSLCRPLGRLLAAALVAVPCVGPAVAQTQAPLQSKAPARTFSPAEKQAFETLIRDYILNNPEVVIESIQSLRQREEKEGRDRAKVNLVKMREEILNDPATPVGGNPEGDVSIVEFFDYRCGFCKRVFPAVMEVLRTDKNVRYVFKEFPILGPDSVTAAKAALAAWTLDKGKYKSFHVALMGTKGALPESRVMRIAAKTGLDVEALKKAMNDPGIEEMIQKNLALAEALDINGTPAFIIGDEVIRGAIDLAALRRLVSQARGS